MNIEEKQYYYNETRTKLISYILLMIFLPFNIYFYNKGIYGEVYIDLGWFGKEFIKDSLYDIPYIILIVGSLFLFIKEIKNSEKTMIIIRKKDKLLGLISFSVISLIFIVVYFTIPEFISITVFIGMFGLVFIALFEVIRELSKKEYISK